MVNDIKRQFIQRNDTEWPIQLSYLGTGLVSAAIVAASTPTLSFRVTNEYPLQISSGEQDSCAGTIAWGPLILYNYSGAGTFTVDHSGLDYPGNQAISLIAKINTNTPQDYAYSEYSVAVHPSAVGAHFSIYASFPIYSDGFRLLLDQYGSAVIYTRQCIPIMARNPVKCLPGGTVAGNADNVKSVDGSCFESWAQAYDTSPKIVKDMCLTGKVGQAILVFGAANPRDIKTLGALPGINMDPNTANTPRSCAITCTVDARSVFEFRSVTLQTQTDTASVSENSDRMANSTSRAADSSIGIAWYLTAENSPSFPQNQSYLANVEGLVALALAALGNTAPGTIPCFALHFARVMTQTTCSRMCWDMTGTLMASRINTFFSWSPEASIALGYLRIGSGKPLAVVYVVPPLFAAAVLAWLMVEARKKGGERRVGEEYVRCSTIDLVGLTEKSRLGETVGRDKEDLAASARRDGPLLLRGESRWISGSASSWPHSAPPSLCLLPLLFSHITLPVVLAGGLIDSKYGG